MNHNIYNVLVPEQCKLYDRGGPMIDYNRKLIEKFKRCDNRLCFFRNRLSRIVVSVSLELLQCNLELKNSLKTLSYQFEFYVGEKYKEWLLVDFSDYNRWSIGWGNPIISGDRLWNLNRFPPWWDSNGIASWCLSP